MHIQELIQERNEFVAMHRSLLRAAGVRTVNDIRGDLDRQGRELKVSIVGVGDEIAAAANLLIGEAAEGTPVAVVRGLDVMDPAGCGADLVRPAIDDMFR